MICTLDIFHEPSQSELTMNDLCKCYIFINFEASFSTCHDIFLKKMQSNAKKLLIKLFVESKSPSTGFRIGESFDALSLPAHLNPFFCCLSKIAALIYVIILILYFQIYKMKISNSKSFTFAPHWFFNKYSKFFGNNDFTFSV